jgi:hypothetical protein
VEVFANLLARPRVALAEPGAAASGFARYIVLECFPTSAWRSSGLDPLPAKGKRPALAPYVRALAVAYGLPLPSVSSHDDLQAVVAALTAVAAAAGPAVVDIKGVPSTVLAGSDGSQRRIEGFIWDVKPLRRVKGDQDG